MSDVPGKTQGQAAEATGAETLEIALVALRREQAACPGREIALAVTKAEEASMWREKVPPPQESEAAA